MVGEDAAPEWLETRSILAAVGSDESEAIGRYKAWGLFFCLYRVILRGMARPLRLEFRGALYHVTSRGDGREDIFLCDGDRLRFLEILGDVWERFNWTIHALCQMTSHYHLVVETPDANLSNGMRQLNGVYTQEFNRTHNRVGHVFQGRYKGILVEKENYLLELARYVVLNPVRAGMVDSPGQWPWNCYRAMVGEEAAPEWLETR